MPPLASLSTPGGPAQPLVGVLEASAERRWLTRAELDVRPEASSTPEGDRRAILTRLLTLVFAALSACAMVMVAFSSPAAIVWLVLPIQGAATACYVMAYVLARSRHRDTVDRLRRELLEAHNRELEELCTTLEDRRTRELTEAMEQLARAHRTQRAQHELLLGTEKMAAIGRLTAGFAHELASPLQAVAAALVDLEALCREYARAIGDVEVTPDDHAEITLEMAEALELAKGGIQRCTRFVSSLRAHTRDPGPLATERFDPMHVAGQALDLLSHIARQAGIRFVVNEPEEQVVLNGVPSRFHQLITNLLQNAIDAIAERGQGGVVTVRCDHDGDQAVLRVEDDGPGIPTETIARIFEPMFTTKPYGKGTGLGLTIVHEIVRNELKGSIEVENRPGGGAAFVVRCPVAEGGSCGA